MPEGNASPERRFREGDGGKTPEELHHLEAGREPTPLVQQAVAAGVTTAAAVKEVIQAQSYGVPPQYRGYMHMGAMSILVGLGLILFFDWRSENREYRKANEILMNQMVNAVQQNTRAIDKLTDRMDRLDQRKLPTP